MLEFEPPLSEVEVQEDSHYAGLHGAGAEASRGRNALLRVQSTDRDHAELVTAGLTTYRPVGTINV